MARQWLASGLCFIIVSVHVVNCQLFNPMGALGGLGALRGAVQSAMSGGLGGALGGGPLGALSGGGLAGALGGGGGGYGGMRGFGSLGKCKTFSNFQMYARFAGTCRRECWSCCKSSFFFFVTTSASQRSRVKVKQQFYK